MGPTNKIDVVRQSQHFVNLELPSVSIANRAAKFYSVHVYNSHITLRYIDELLCFLFVFFLVKLFFITY